MSKRAAAVIAGTILCALTFVVPGRAQAQYPYTLIDPGTFGGPSSYLDEPGIPFTSDGTLLGTADTTTFDSRYLNCPSNFCDGYRQHAFAWRDGKLTDLGVLPGTTGSFIDQLNGQGVGVGGAENGFDPNNPGGIAVLFAHGQVISLGTLPGGSQSFAQNINNQGQVAG